MKTTLKIATLLAGVAFTAPAFAANIVETASRAGTFNTLIAAAKAAGLADLLATKGHITVFAPTDAAFAALPPGTVESLLRPENKDKLAAILSYHVVGRAIPAARVPTERTQVRTLKATGDRSIAVRRQGSGVTVDNARVIQADIKADNGIIHVIDRVLIPSR